MIFIGEIYRKTLVYMVGLPVQRSGSGSNLWILPSLFIILPGLIMTRMHCVLSV